MLPQNHLIPNLIDLCAEYDAPLQRFATKTISSNYSSFFNFRESPKYAVDESQEEMPAYLIEKLEFEESELSSARIHDCTLL